MTKQEVMKLIKTTYNKNRCTHTLGVIEVIEKIAKRHNIDLEKAFIAAAFHDYSKATMSSQDELAYLIDKNIDLSGVPKAMYHGFASAYLLREKFSINDNEIFDAIYYHVSGKTEMTPLEKVLYVADTCEPNRVHEYRDIIFETALTDLDEALKIAVNVKSSYTLSKRKTLHQNTIELMEEMGLNDE